MNSEKGDEMSTQRPSFDWYRNRSYSETAESTSRLRSGMKDLGEAGLRRRLSLLAHCHMPLCCDGQLPRVFFDLNSIACRNSVPKTSLRDVGTRNACRTLRSASISTEVCTTWRWMTGS